jgi:flagellum-specific peptidoglycan hydrolase FlgJ
MRKNLLLTSVAIANTLATVAVPTVVSAETTDTTDSNTKTNLTQESNTADPNSIAVETQESSDMPAGNEESKVIVGPKVEQADPTVAHASDAEGLKIAESNVMSRSYQSQMAWIEEIGPMAQRSASRYNLYASVMMAQAIIESGWGGSSLAMPPNHNLFGIKGSYNGQSVWMNTAEWSPSAGWYYINAAFAKYPSYEQSFDDNGNKLRNGLTWNHAFYQGTWKENCNSYRDSTAWLQGRYATAPNYAQVLNNIIENYGLTKYDSAPTPEPDTNAGTEAPINGDHFEMDDVGIIKNPNGAKMYIQADPNTPSKRTLGANTDWLITGRVVTPEGDLYYQVSTYEYVKASDMQVKSEVDESSKHRIIKANNPESFAVPLMAFKDDKPVRGNRGLSNNSFWAVDKTKVYDGHTYYRVSTNEWIIDTYATVTQ